MPRRATTNRSGRTTDPSTDKAHNTVSEDPTGVWHGGQVERGPWFEERLEALRTIFEWKHICENAAVSISSRGTVAVFSANHAKEHLAGSNKGSIREPNMRMRETIDATVPTQQQPPLALSPAHRGYPGAPIPTVPTPAAAPAQTYATTVSTSGRPITQLEQELGAHASGYIIASLPIEEVDDRMLEEHFLSTINNDRLVRDWRKRCKGSGRRFIVLMGMEIRDEEMSMTGGNTIQAKIDQIVRSGLTEASLHNLFYMMDEYDKWANALPKDAQVSDAKKAYIFQKWVCELSPNIKIQMQINLASIEAKHAAKRIDIRAIDPIGLVQRAATIVLTDETNEAALKSMESGHAFTAQSYKGDPRKRPLAAGAGGTGGWGGGQANDARIWKSPMRPCAMCPENTPEKQREHMDRSCKHFTQEKLDAANKLFNEKRAARTAEYEKTKASRVKNGEAKLASISWPEAGAIDDIEEANMNIFESGMPTVLEIAPISAGTNARALMSAGASSMSAASTTPTPSVTASTFRIYVISNSGNDDENAISTGIYMGTWHDDIVPFINQSYLEHQMNLDIDALKARTKVVSSLEHAVARCVRDDIMPIYQGPQDQWGGPLGFGIGENVERYLNNAMVKDDSEPDEASSDGEPDEESSDGESKCGDCEEPEADENYVPAQRHATTDANDLFDNAPPTQPPSRATKFNADLGNVAAAAVAPMTPGSPGYQLEVLTQRIESVDVNTNIEVLRGIIRDNGLSVSPATGAARHAPSSR